LNILNFAFAGGSAKPARLPASSKDDSKAPSRSFLSEEVFLEVLCLERKRAERSRRPFLLMLVEAEKLLQADQAELLAANLASTVSTVKRETDFKGWYKDGSVLGVIFTEIGEAERTTLQRAMLSRVMSALARDFKPSDMDQINLSFHFFPEDWEKEHPRRARHLVLYPDVSQRDGMSGISRSVKRAFDIAGSTLTLILLSPLLLVIALAIKLTSKGPVVFRQERVGQFNGRFTFLKFRSMHAANDATIHREYIKHFIAGDVGSAASEQSGPVVYKIQNDPRVTAVGRLLRKTSLDELPQLWNVLRGEMSLVGPRPPIPYELESYEPWHRRRVLEAKPGITGLWQVSGRSRTDFDDMVRLDLRYVLTWSIWLDVKILLQTPGAVFSGDGAY